MMATEKVPNEMLPSSAAPTPAKTSCRKMKKDDATFLEDVKDHINEFIYASMDEHKTCFQKTVKKMFGMSKVVAERSSETEEVESSLPLQTTLTDKEKLETEVEISDAHSSTEELGFCCGSKRSFTEKNKDVAQFRKKGCDHFDKLTEIFCDSTATGDLARASTQGPLKSDEEHEVEEVYIGSNSSHQDISMNDSKDVGASKPLSSSRKDKKRVNNSDVVEEAWMAFKNAQVSKKAMFDRIEGEVKTRDCIIIIEAMNDIPDDQFVKACTEFKDSSMRDMFVAMPDTRRRQWLRSLTR